MTDLTPFLIACDVVDSDSVEIKVGARQISSGLTDTNQIIEACFTFVRDQVLHTDDHQLDEITCRASDVLSQRTGYCYAKSHLLAALLRASKIPAGLGYQRLELGEGVFCLHGLNFVWLHDYGWHRIDPRGNRSVGDASIHTEFSPPASPLAFVASAPGEFDVPGVFDKPLNLVTAALKKCSTREQMNQNLPDISPLQAAGLGSQSDLAVKS